RYRPERRRAALAHLDHAGALLEVVDAERRREARGSRGRQDVVRPGAVVAQAFARERAEEDRTGVDQQRLPAPWLARADLEVLGSDPVADRARFFHRARQHERTATFERRADDVAARL